MKRVLVCGGRDRANPTPNKLTWPHITNAERITEAYRIEEYKEVQQALNLFCLRNSDEFKYNDNWLPTDIVIISGLAKGVDTAAQDFAVCNFAQFEGFKADWNKYGKSAGYIRNKQMLEEGKPDIVFAFPGGKGTTMMVGLAKKAGLPVVEFKFTHDVLASQSNFEDF